MLKPGIYVAKNDENIWDSYMIRMEVKETKKSYVFKLVDFQSRYSAAHIEMLFEKSNKFILRKKKADMPCGYGAMIILHFIRIKQVYLIFSNCQTSERKYDCI